MCSQTEQRERAERECKRNRSIFEFMLCMMGAYYSNYREVKLLVVFALNFRRTQDLCRHLVQSRNKAIIPNADADLVPIKE